VVVGGFGETPRGFYDPRYVERRRIAAPLTAQGLNRRTSPPCHVLEMQVSNAAPAIHLTWGCWRRFRFEESSYEEADRLPELHEDDVEWLAAVRPAVHELKSRTLAELRKALSSGPARKLWQRVIAGVADRLDADQVGRLLRL